MCWLLCTRFDRNDGWAGVEFGVDLAVGLKAGYGVGLKIIAAL